MASGLILDYLGSGNVADRPATPDLYTGSLGLWFATDTEVLSLWDGSTWTDVTGSAVNSVNGLTGAVILALDDLDDVDAAAPADGDVLTWNATAGRWEPAAAGGGGGSNDLTIITEASAFTADPATHSGRQRLILAGGDVTFDTAESYTTGNVFNIRATAALELLVTGVTLTPPAGGTLELDADMAVSVAMTSSTAGVVIGQTVAAP